MIASRNFGIREAHLDDVGAVTGTLAEAFLSGDLPKWLVGDRETRRSVFADYFRIFAEFFLERGQVDATEDTDAVALWWPVGECLDMDIPDFDERLAKATGPAFGRFVLLGMAMHAHHPQFRPHHYLAFVAVQPDQQGQGMGTALLRYRLAELDRQQVPSYLEATSIQSRALYQRHGYKMTHPIDIDIPNGPTLFPMWRAVGGHA